MFCIFKLYFQDVITICERNKSVSCLCSNYFIYFFFFVREIFLLHMRKLRLKSDRLI